MSGGPVSLFALKPLFPQINHSLGRAQADRLSVQRADADAQYYRVLPCPPLLGVCTMFAPGCVSRLAKVPQPGLGRKSATRTDSEIAAGGRSL